MQSLQHGLILSHDPFDLLASSNFVQRKVFVLGCNKFQFVIPFFIFQGRVKLGRPFGSTLHFSGRDRVNRGLYIVSRGPLSTDSVLDYTIEHVLRILS